MRGERGEVRGERGVEREEVGAGGHLLDGGGAPRTALGVGGHMEGVGVPGCEVPRCCEAFPGGPKAHLEGAIVVNKGGGGWCAWM